jgi:hypothetical protein
MKYERDGYNRLFAGELYNWQLDRFENIEIEEDA